MQAFIERHDLAHFTHLNDEDTVLWDRFGADGRSTFLFLNDDGSFWRTGYGEADLASLTRRVEELIAA